MSIGRVRRREEGGGVDPAGDWWVVAPCLKTARERERGTCVLRTMNESTEPLFMQYRYKLSAPTAATLPSNAYHGNLKVETFVASAPVSTWIRKKSRALRVFYFLSEEVVQANRLETKKRRLLEKAGEDTTLPNDPSHFYLPLEPGQMLWLAFPVPSGATVEEAVTEALWSPISKEAALALRWFTTYLYDPEITPTYTLHESTATFLHDYKLHCIEGTPMGMLSNYIGTIQNDGSVHARRRPGTSYPCVV